MCAWNSSPHLRSPLCSWWWGLVLTKMCPAQWVTLRKPRPIFLGRCGSLNFHICTQFWYIVQLAACGGSFGRVVALIANSYMCVCLFCWWAQQLEFFFLFLLICRENLSNTCHNVLSFLTTSKVTSATLPSFQIWSPCWLQRQWRSWWWSAWSTCPATSPKPSAAPTPLLLQLARRHRYSAHLQEESMNIMPMLSTTNNNCIHVQ